MVVGHSILVGIQDAIAIEDGRLLGKDIEYREGKLEAKRVLRIAKKQDNLDKKKNGATGLGLK